MRKGQFSAMYKKALSGLLTINLLFLLGVLSLCRMEDIKQKMQQTVRQTQAEERLLRGFSPEERAQLKSLLVRVADNLN